MQFISPNVILEDIQLVKRPIFHLDEVSQLYEDVMKNIDKTLVIPKDIFNTFKIKDELNKDIWNQDTLHPHIKNKLLKLAKEFFKTLEIPVKIKDVLFVGSLANYNWSRFSDIDLHIVLDFKELNPNIQQTKIRFDAQKNLWNANHDITIMDFPIEVYVQDVKEKLESSAIYSIPKDKWIVKPEKTKFKLDKPVIKRKVTKLFDILKDIKHNYDTHKYNQVVSQTDKLKKSIKNMRQAGLDKHGEFSTENVIFKILRRTNFMDILDTYKIKAIDKTISLH